MKLHELKPKAGAVKTKKRIGRGNGSGHGTFSGRGCKGQNSRTGGGVRPGFEGGQTPLILRMPKLKGFKSMSPKKFQAVNLEKLNRLAEGQEVTLETLYQNKLIAKKTLPVKILGQGELQKKLTFKGMVISVSAKAKILAAGGEIV